MEKLMSKEKKGNKESKKQPLMTLKEKRAAKKGKHKDGNNISAHMDFPQA
jgi:hypothetical protein